MTENPYRNWRYRIDDERIGWLTIKTPADGPNVLGREVLEELGVILDLLEKEPPRGVIIGSGKKNGFIAGADVKEFTTLTNAADALPLIERGQSLFDRIENLACPTIALIGGFCLGGGMELALACRYRIANTEPSTRMGLPEVLLGIHPGFGGAVRLPHLIGAPAALDMILTGRTVDGRRAKKMGLVDIVTPLRHFTTAAVGLVRKPPKASRPSLPLRMVNQTSFLRSYVAGKARTTVAKKALQQHYPAPYALLDLWENFGDSPRRMMREEAASVSRLIGGDTAQNLIRVFFLQERMKGMGGKIDFPVSHVHVIGAGAMGGDIALWIAGQGIRVTLQDTDAGRLTSAFGRAAKLYQKKFKQPRLIQAALDRLIPDISGNGVARADLVIEAIFENGDVKRELYRSIEPKMKEGALLCTNTSSIPLEELSEALTDPSRLVGLHFFNPVPKMKLVEVVRGEATSDETINKAAAFTKRIDRLPIPVKSSPGFLVNRILMPYLMEAVAMVEEGIAPNIIDKAATDFGMPMGPILLADTVGLDICLAVSKVLGAALGGETPKKLIELTEAGHLGMKSGRGFYPFTKGKADIPKMPDDVSIPPDVTDRLVMSLLNESVACLREGVVEDADLLDAGIIFGAGFAPFRGGPMKHLTDSGPERLKKTIEGLAERVGERFKPDPAWPTETTPAVTEKEE